MSDTIIILPEPLSTTVQVELPPSTFKLPRTGGQPIRCTPQEIGYFNCIGPSGGSDIWKIEPCKYLKFNSRCVKNAHKVDYGPNAGNSLERGRSQQHR